MMSPLTEKLASAIVGAALAGGGATLVTNWHTNGVQDAEIEQVEARQERLEASVDKLLDALDETHTEVALLNQRLDWMEREKNPNVEP